MANDGVYMYSVTSLSCSDTRQLRFVYVVYKYRIMTFCMYNARMKTTHRTTQIADKNLLFTRPSIRGFMHRSCYSGANKLQAYTRPKVKQSTLVEPSEKKYFSSD